jgi:methionine-S-sulfoxide reductase
MSYFSLLSQVLALSLLKVWFLGAPMTLASSSKNGTQSSKSLLMTTQKSKPESMEKKEVTVLAGGCFWGVEDLIRKIPGVTAVEVGYSGGTIDNATYEIVKTGTSGHAESVRIEFDPSVLSFEKLLEHFFKLHDPTTKNQQGNDRGTQYRSVIFYTNEQQKETALKMIDRVNKSHAWKNPVVTEVVPFKKFIRAEEYHQDYLEKHPNGYTCHYYRKIDF